jgi:nucleotide-binding universal stress UspA family protein
MFKHLLVPLDGSRLAEAAIPAAVCIAKKGNAIVTLLHIIERDAPEKVHGERHLRAFEEAAAYLDKVARQHFGGIQTHCHVHTAEIKDVARGIADHLIELDPDTVAMSAHGHGGLLDLLFGNIAQQVVAFGSMPVLLVRPGNGFGCRRVLIPHDGAPAHESALNAGTEFARLCGADVQLVMVIPTRGTLAGMDAAAGQMLPGATRAMLEMAQRDAADHLRGHAEELKAGGISAGVEVLRGDPTLGIVKAGDAFEADVIVLGTHGKSGAKAFWEGSVAARVAMKTRASLLFVPVGKK